MNNRDLAGFIAGAALVFSGYALGYYQGETGGAYKVATGVWECVVIERHGRDDHISCYEPDQGRVGQ